MCAVFSHFVLLLEEEEEEEEEMEHEKTLVRAAWSECIFVDLYPPGYSYPEGYIPSPRPLASLCGGASAGVLRKKQKGATAHRPSALYVTSTPCFCQPRLLSLHIADMSPCRNTQHPS